MRRRERKAKEKKRGREEKRKERRRRGRENTIIKSTRWMSPRFSSISALRFSNRSL
jgi:hypothetical protein